MANKSQTCRMCHRRPKPLTAERDGSVYVNAQRLVMFCSVRCAANYGLLWGVPEIEQYSHWCQKTCKWEPIEKENCHRCRKDR